MRHANPLASWHPCARPWPIVEADLPQVQRDAQEQARHLSQCNLRPSANLQGINPARRVSLVLPQLQLDGDRR